MIVSITMRFTGGFGVFADLNCDSMMSCFISSATGRRKAVSTKVWRICAACRRGPVPV